MPNCLQCEACSKMFEAGSSIAIDEWNPPYDPKQRGGGICEFQQPFRLFYRLSCLDRNGARYTRFDHNLLEFRDKEVVPKTWHRVAHPGIIAKIAFPHMM